MSDPSATVVEKHPGAVVVRIQAVQLDEANISAVRSEVDAAGSESPQACIVVDMVNVGYLPSLSLAGLIQRSQVFKSRGQRLVMARMQPPVREIFTVTRLDRLFEIHDDLAAFLKSAGMGP
jgi:anti-sigma B factor antagonist